MGGRSLPPHHHYKLLPNKNNLCADRRYPRPLCSWRGRRSRRGGRRDLCLTKIPPPLFFFPAPSRQTSGLKSEPTEVAGLSGPPRLLFTSSRLHPLSVPTAAAAADATVDGECGVLRGFASLRSTCAVHPKVKGDIRVWQNWQNY